MLVLIAGFCGALAVDCGGKAVNREGFAVETETKSQEKGTKKRSIYFVVLYFYQWLQQDIQEPSS